MWCGRNFVKLQKKTEKWIQLSGSYLVSNKRGGSLGEKFKVPDRYGRFLSSIWVEFNNLAHEFKPINLGQGFADFAAPEHVTESLKNLVLKEDDILLHQYTRGYGHPRLVKTLGVMYSKLIGCEIDPLNEILVTVGAYEALFSSIHGHCHAGDEFIIIEPSFDCYEPMVVAAGGVPVFVPLRPKETEGQVKSSDWKLDEEELESKFNEKTKGIILNTPHNPLGKVFTQEELQVIADLCIKWNTLCISDEVYEWLVFQPNKHVRIATLPDMWERTITIGSAGKTFNVTGWKIGWAYGPADLIFNLCTVHQNCIFTCPTPLQEAVARGLEREIPRIGQPDCYFSQIQATLLPKRDFMVEFLKEVGMNPVEPQGGYFIVADWTPLEGYVNLDEESDPYKDYRFVKWMTKNVKVQGIPVSGFYSVEDKYLGENYVRYCFIKKDENLRKAAQVLKDWKNSCTK